MIFPDDRTTKEALLNTLGEELSAAWARFYAIEVDSRPGELEYDRALAAAKARGKKLGGFRGRAGTAEDTAKARKAHTAKAASHAASLVPIITRLDPNGSLSLRALAAKLTADGLPTPAGAPVWTATTVARVKARLAA